VSGNVNGRSNAWKVIYAGRARAPDAVEPGREHEELDPVAQFVPEQPRRTLQTLIVPGTVREQIDTAMSKIKCHDILYERWNLQKLDPFGRRVAINLVGPPGTGKSLCAEAIAHEFQTTLIRVNYAEIESKYVGETPKNIVAAFKLARETGSVLFFDEADSILGKRLTHVTQSADHSVNVTRSVLFTQLDRFEGVVIFASNLPENYDGAFARRILAHIEFVLPDYESRCRLWGELIPQELPCDPDITIETLAAATDGFSGGEMSNALILAATRAARRAGVAGRVGLQDLEAALAQVRAAKHRIGS
jgi:ATP-dependent 26S proteasome regulatory subunit